MSLLTADVLQGFTETILAVRYDDPKPVPFHHHEMWELCCSNHPQVAIAAPRGSAKSTAVTFAYVIAAALFEEHSHILIISANEELASAFLNDIRVELQENDFIQNDPLLGIKRFVKERETELIVEKKTGFKFRIIAKGAMQRMRGLKWERKRPSMVILDDVEDEELVASDDRRDKFKRWFFGAVKPILRDGGTIRMVGTIMHLDSLLNGFMPDPKKPTTVQLPLKTYSTEESSWKSVLYKAHNEDFSQLLWPEMYPEARLRAIRQDASEQGMLDVYGQEYLNDPIDKATAYFRKEDFLPMRPQDHETHKIHYAAGDLAITKNARSAYTALGVGGLDSERTLHIVDVRRDRWDGLAISSEMFSLQTRWEIDTFRLESENIEKAIGPFIKDRMGRTIDGIYHPFISIDSKPATKDKEARAQSIRAMMRAGKVRFNKEAAWYPDLEEELLHFPKWKYKDQVDMLAWLGLMIAQMSEGYTAQQLEEDEFDDEYEKSYSGQGVSMVTGY